MFLFIFINKGVLGYQNFTQNPSIKMLNALHILLKKSTNIIEIIINIYIIRFFSTSTLIIIFAFGPLRDRGPAARASPPLCSEFGFKNK